MSKTATFYSNGRIIIEKFNDEQALTEAVEKLKGFLLSERGLDATFEKAKDIPYPAYLIPQGVSFHDLDECLRPHIALKAINEDEIVLTGTKTVNVRYNFTDDELKNIAIENMNLQSELAKVNSQKSVAMKEFSRKIEELEGGIDETRDKHQQGHEWRDYACVVKINFTDKKKYYLDKQEEGTIRKVDDLDKSDYQLQMDHKFEQKVETGSLFAGEGEEAEVQEKKPKKGKGTKADPIVVQMPAQEDGEIGNDGLPGSDDQDPFS